MTTQQYVYICSDSTGETIEGVTQATIRQFQTEGVIIKRYSHIKMDAEIEFLAAEAAVTGGFIAYTFVKQSLSEKIKLEAERYGIAAVDVLGPMMQAFVDTHGGTPKQKPGLLHKMDEDYFRRVEAVEFAVKYDDGKDARGMLKAQVVIIGISRTSKTPLSIYLAHKGMKAANLPLMPEIKPPSELFLVPNTRVIGLTMDAEKILEIRKERLKVLGLPNASNYATLQRIVEELEYAQSLIKKIGCININVTNKAIEETAGIIMEHIK